MKNWIISSVLLLFLTACTNNNMVEDTMNKQDNEEPVIDMETDVEENPSSPEENNDEIVDEPVTDGQSEKEQTNIGPQYKISADWSIVPINDANPKVVLLTIDDAPDRYTLHMAETLHTLGVKAIFFVNGHYLDTEEEKQVLKEIHRLGFPIGNHTMSHKRLSTISEEEQSYEIIELNNVVEEIIGERPKFFRAPFGINTDYAKEIVKDEGMLLMNWSYGYDWEPDYKTKETITEIMVNAPELRDGANLLMHDREWTSEAIEDIVVGLQDKGYEIVDPDLIETP
ncbi:polysaccharide deacetylase family protein [Sutcliffiella cohnii]